MTPEEFDRLEWDDYHALNETMQREQRETQNVMAGLRGRA